MRTLNVKRTVIFLVVVIAVAGSTHLLHSYQLQRKASFVKNQAETAWKDFQKANQAREKLEDQLADNKLDPAKREELTKQMEQLKQKMAERTSDALQMMTAYLGLEPRDYKAREELGFWFAESGRYAAASATLEELLRTFEAQTSPDASNLQRLRWKLIEIAMEHLGRPADALFHLDKLAAELPDNADIWVQRGKCLNGLGQEAKAVESFSRAIAMRPEQVDIYYFKAMTLRSPRLDRLPEAEECMAQMIAYWDKDPSGKDRLPSARAHLIYGKWLADEMGSYYDKQTLHDAARERYDGALKQAEAELVRIKPIAPLKEQAEKKLAALKQAQAEPALIDQAQKEVDFTTRGEPDGLYLGGKANLALRHFPEAEKYARQGIEAAPEDFAMYVLMADICMTRTDQPDKTIDEQREAAIQVLNSGVETVPAEPAKGQLLWHLANLYLDDRRSAEGSLAAAEECIRRMRDYHYSPAYIAFLEARLRYAREDWKGALAGFDKVRAALGDFPPLMKCLDYWTGYCYLQQQNPDQAMAAFRAALGYDKFYFKAHDGIAQVLLANGKIREAIGEYQQAVKGNLTDVEARLALARTLVLWNRQRSPAEQDWDEVAEQLKTAEILSPRSSQIHLLKGEMWLAQGDADRVQKWLEDNFKDSNAAEFWVARSNLAAEQGHIDAARQILGEAKAKLGDQALLRLAEARILLRELGLRAGAELEKLAAGAGAFSAKEKIQLLRGLMDDLVDIKEYDAAKRLCRQIADLEPHDATIRYRLLELALLTHSVRDPAPSLAELDGVLAEIDAIAGRGPLWLYGKALRLKLEAGRDKPALLDAAMDYAAQAQAMRVDWSRPQVLMGEICREKGRDEEALQYYLRALINGDRDLEFIRRLLQMLYERQRYQEADQVIKRLESSQTALTGQIRKQETDILLRAGDFDRALESAKTAYNSAADDYREHVWHGRVLRLLLRRAQQEGHADKAPAIAQQAEDSLRRACLLAPNAPECRVELVQLLVAAKQMEKARVAASDAEQMIPLAVRPLAMGYIHEALGESEKAGQDYEKAVSLRPDLPQAVLLLAEFQLRHRDFQQAAQLIGPILSGESQASESDLVAARRIEAAILETEGYPKLKKALELVDRNLKSPLASPQDKRLKVRLLLDDPAQAGGPEVLELSTGLVETGAEPEDRFQLARLHLARGNWNRCRELMEKLVSGDQGSLRYLAVYVRMLLDHDQLVDAEQWLDRLQRAGKTSESVAFRAELLFREKKWGEVPGFLADYIREEKAGHPLSGSREDQAESGKDPLERVLFAARLLEELGSRLTAPAQRGMATTYFQEVRQWYEGYNQKRPGRELLLAGFLARRGKVDEALDLLQRFGVKAAPLDLAVAVAAVTRCETVKPPQLRQVEQVLDQTAAAQKQPIPLLNAKIVLKIRQEEFAAAEDLCRQIIARDPKDHFAYNNLGELLALSGNKLDEALAMVNRAIDLAGPLPALLDSRAVVHLARNEPRQALEDLKSIQAEKVDPVWIFHKARALLLEGENEGALAALVEAREKGLDRAMIDPPERPLFDQLQEKLVKFENEN